MISDEKKWKIEQIINTCKGVCEVGWLLHELWTAYRSLEDFIKDHDQQAWDDLQNKIRSKDDEI